MSIDPPRLHSPDEHEPQEMIEDPIEDPQSPDEERRRASFVVPHKLLIAVMMLLLVYLIAAALGLEISFFSSGSGEPINPTPTSVFDVEGSTSSQNIARDPQGSSDATLPAEAAGPPIALQPIAPVFQEYWERNGGVPIFGHPISDLKTAEDGRQFQWFERSRLEYSPGLAGSAYAVQPGLVGVEFTEDIQFPQQQFFPSRPDLWYFPETGHAVGGRFLQFWLNKGGLDLFGYPISEEIREVLPSDGQVHVVQYFERARLEYHPQFAGTENEVMLGLLGRGIFLQKDKPRIVPESLILPTPVPVQP